MNPRSAGRTRAHARSRRSPSHRKDPRTGSGRRAAASGGAPGAYLRRMCACCGRTAAWAARAASCTGSSERGAHRLVGFEPAVLDPRSRGTACGSFPTRNESPTTRQSLQRLRQSGARVVRVVAAALIDVTQDRVDPPSRLRRYGVAGSRGSCAADAPSSGGARLQTPIRDRRPGRGPAPRAPHHPKLSGLIDNPGARDWHTTRSSARGVGADRGSVAPGGGAERNRPRRGSDAGRERDARRETAHSMPRGNGLPDCEA